MCERCEVCNVTLDSVEVEVYDGMCASCHNSILDDIEDTICFGVYEEGERYEQHIEPEA